MNVKQVFDGDWRDLQVCFAFVCVLACDHSCDYDYWTWAWGFTACIWFAKWVVGMTLIIFDK